MGPLADLELAPLNPDLGQYFGTSEGVLVINVPSESSLGLKGGDVILSVDGRKATGPNGLLRILRSYDEGDSFKLDIMRNKTRTTVTGKLEARNRE
jgi:S1-C subfamily serine protease